MNNDEFEDEYQEPTDIPKFMSSLKTAWNLVPELGFGQVIDLVFNGYNLFELTAEESQEMIDEFIIQNQ